MMATTWMSRYCEDCLNNNLGRKYNSCDNCASCGRGIDIYGNVIKATIREEKAVRLLWHAMELVKEYNKVTDPEYKDYMKFTNTDKFLESLIPFTKGIIEEYNNFITPKRDGSC